MSWFPWRKAPAGQVGLEIGAEFIAFAHIDTNTPPRAQLTACEMLLATDGSLPMDSLRQRVEQLGLTGSPCNLVLPSSYYQLMLVEAPKVPAEELNDALRFRIKDMIAFPIDEALLDTFDLPTDSSRSGRHMVYAVVTEEAKIKPLIEAVAEAGLNLQSIDIAEMALRNLTEKLPVDARGVAVMRVLPGQGMLTLMREGQLYLSRQFDLRYNGGLFDDLPEEQLVLELQRSLDYYERQMGQVPPGNVYLCGENVTDDKIGDDLSGGIAAAVTTLNISGLLQIKEGIDESVMQLCVTAIGGALRGNAEA
ncbi:MSHA biogenesis protein MshI [Pseudomaricurvus alkylphenolicus]|jgi:MSHA biogenesis protein MshI|uniref:MSHA biogenesis protein MshI n=1 Tax=Pseudomaricurvus alkylphenolicus TaxID=1306991 RepID=UPI001421D5D2|nr:MSHA biogenesis protein MshI [Pseudomaricurvus alkylphenolicus]NIB44382.1 MSHA biogenesis protein MshI [Pseudomaricurvus alkylphenolicus]